MNTLIIIIFMLILSVLAWALFGGERREVKAPGEEAGKTPDNEPEKILRRRASDRAIEEEFPERRRTDDISHEIIPKSDDTQAPFELPYSANSIIPDNSRFRMYKRTLINSEIYARKGNIDTAISLFNGVKDRISDKGIRSKIDANIEYLNHFREMMEKGQKKRFESLYSGQQPGELRLKIDGPVPQTINIGVSDKTIDSDEVIKKISEQIAAELGHLKNEIDNIKSKPEEKTGLDDYARIASLQGELDSLKEKFQEISAEKDKTLSELEKIRNIKEEELALSRERGTVRVDAGDYEILSHIKDEIKNLTDLKFSLDKLNTRIEDLAAIKIPESKTAPTVVEAKYSSPEPVHFDAKPVLDILDRISRESERIREPEPHKTHVRTYMDEYREPSVDDFTHEEIESLVHETSVPAEHEEPLFPSGTSGIPSVEGLPSMDKPEQELPEETELFADETVQELPAKEEQPQDKILHEEPPAEKEPEAAVLHEEPPAEKEPEAAVLHEELPAEEEPEAAVLHEELPAEEEPEAAVLHEEPPVEEELQDEKIRVEAEKSPVPEEHTAETMPYSAEEKTVPDYAQHYPEEITLPQVPGKQTEEPEIKETAKEEKPLPDEELFRKSEKVSEKEKEIDRYTDMEEDPNAFELMSEYGKIKDDSTLTDEEIFEKIITEDSKKRDDTDFEILGEKHREEQEYSFDAPLDEKKKAEQDFYKKFIKPDRIKKRELPILKVSYDFKKLPDEFSLSREKNILEYSFYKYKPMLQKADDFIKQRRVRDAINYYKVVADQNIPPEFKIMIKRNIRDLTEYLEKYLTTE